MLEFASSCIYFFVSLFCCLQKFIGKNVPAVQIICDFHRSATISLILNFENNRLDLGQKEKNQKYFFGMKIEPNPKLLFCFRYTQ